MMIAVFEQTSSAFKLFILLGLLLFGTLLGMLTGLALAAIFYGLPVDMLILDQESARGLQVARLMQLSGQLGLFVFPPLFYAWLTNSRPLQSLGFKGLKNTEVVLFGVLTMFVSLPLIHFLGEWNSQLHLPESMASIEQWMLTKENQAAELSERFLQVTTISGLAFNLCMTAVIPTINEELVFRGALQPLLIRLFKNAHIGIILASLLFGLMHLQFYGLLPRVVLGLFLGYYFYYSRSLWLPILMHFVNNGTAVIVYYLNYNGFIDIEMENFGASEVMWLVIFSLLLVVAGIVYAKQKFLSITNAVN
ncbi:MAG TPA: CPBP family intramembrane metalloprotease [Bacteroidales bacterium]|nr:CPBP family intramembrane metalloprotease [Bacteroidales bacterium]